MNSVILENPVQRDAMRYLEDQAYAALLGYKEPVRAAEIISAIGKEEYTSKLVRHVLAASPRFAKIDRRWDLEIRYEDKQRPMERVLGDIISECGRPMTVIQIADELSSIFDRQAEFYEPMLQRLLAAQDKYFHISGELYGLETWLLEITSTVEEEIVLDNGLDDEEIQLYEDAAAKIKWSASDIPGDVKKFLDIVKTPVSDKIIGLFLWRALGGGFDPVSAFKEMYDSSDLVLLSDQRWATSKMVKEYDKILIETADQLADEIMEEAPIEVVEKAEVAEDVPPTLSLTISDRDLDEVAQIVSAKGEEKMPMILESIFEISPRDPIYAVAAEGLGDAMRVDPRFTWVGTERWRMADTLPKHINDVPSELTIRKYDFETPEGERLDVELDDDGLEGSLAVEIKNPLVQDIGDQEPITEQDEMPAVESARCVVTKHHKQLGTFPLCQIPKSFFPLAPSIIEMTLIDGEKRGEIWINRETGLIYDMGDWYAKDMLESGAVFELVRTQRPDEFQYVYKGINDPQVSVSPSRIEELVELGKNSGEMTTFELMSEIMQGHRKGVAFVTLFTEVNLARRTTRRLVASILSSYYAFYQRPKSAVWQFDEKKVDQGFKKAKRKYVRK